MKNRDLRNRVLARGPSPDTPVLRALTRLVTTLPVDAPLFEMLLLMLEHRVHHVPLMEHDEIIAVVTDTDLLRHHLKSPFHLLRSVERSEDPSQLAGYSQRLSGIIESMVASGLDAGQIGRVVATLNEAVVVRRLRAAESDFGPPPCRSAWIVFGSEGRRQQAMLTDQHNAIIYADDTTDAATYFSSVAEQLARGLTETGFPRYAGDFMATSWRRPFAAWIDLFQSWIREPRPEALLEAANFFDFRSVHGGLSLSPLDEVVAGAHRNHVFIAHLVKAALRFRPPLGLFRTIKEEDGGVGVKSGGIIPIVSMARTYGLEAASRARGTLERLEAARAAEILSDEGFHGARRRTGPSTSKPPGSTRDGTGSCRSEWCPSSMV